MWRQRRCICYFTLPSLDIRGREYNCRLLHTLSRRLVLVRSFIANSHVHKMLAFQSLLLCSSLLPLIHAASCSGYIGTIASYVSGYPEAQSFCSAKFPLPQKIITGATTTVSTTLTTTVIVTPWTATATCVNKVHLIVCGS